MVGQGARVRADPHRRSLRLRGLHDLRGLFGAADVSGIDANGRDSCVDRLERERRVEVDIGDHRDRRKPDDLRQRRRVLVLRNGHARDLAAGRCKRGDLRGRRLDVVRLRQRHRLHDDGSAAADLHSADGDLPLARHGARLAASDSADVVREADEEEHQHERDAHRGEAFVHLAWDRPAAHRLEERQEDVPAVQRQER